MIQTGKTSGEGALTPGADLRGLNSNLDSFHQVVFPTPFHPSFEVVVHVQTQTFNGADTPGIRIAKVNNEGFLWRMNEVVVSGGTGHEALSVDGRHGEEEIGWVAYGSPKS